MTEGDEIVEILREMAHAEGFSVLGVCPAAADEVLAERLDAFLKQNYHGEMAWLAETRDRRVAPTAMWDGARSAIVLAMNYAPEHNPMDNLKNRSGGNISVYARGRDYHGVIKGKLKQIAARLAQKTGEQVKVFVDTAPMMEKPLAAAAGLGWQGKHTNLVSRDFGSWLFLGVILTSATLPLSSPEGDHCGTCTKCLDICPTEAFPAPYQLDARRCISYLTIEYDGVIPHEFRAAIGNRIFGCDDCLAVCPWNRFAQRSREIKFRAREATDMPPLATLLELDEARFRVMFQGTPLRRSGYRRMMRNILMAAGNSGASALITQVEKHLSAESPLIRGMAVWAFARLVDVETLKKKAAIYQVVEDNNQVLSEWQDALKLLH